MNRPSRSSTETGTVTSEALTRTTSSSPTSSETSPRLRCAGLVWPDRGAGEFGKGVGAVAGALVVEGSFVTVVAGVLCPARRGRDCAKRLVCAATQKTRNVKTAANFLMTFDSKTAESLPRGRGRTNL